MERLPKKSLSMLSSASGLRPDYLSAIVCARKRPSRKLALKLDSITAEIGERIPAAVWIFGTSREIKTALLEVIRRSNP